jgi:hypothetical protein
MVAVHCPLLLSEQEMFEERLQSEEKLHRGAAFLSASSTTTKFLAAAVTTVWSWMGGRKDRNKTRGRKSATEE